ncbi:MAG TPA: OmpH family outer membrane protein [Zeimonas sp.]|nr:OmpH family outer membrane protein [Zeimonas sp.]
MKFLGWLAACALAVACVPAFAQGTAKIGFVNTERILRDATPAKSAQQKLEQEFSKREKELQDMGSRLRALGERIDRDASVMSDADRLRRQREFADLEKEFQRRQREFREDLNQRRNEELAQVIDQVNRAIKQIAEQENYDLILQEAVVASPRIDITDKVLRALANGKP